MTEKQNKELLKLIAKGIREFPKTVARKERAYREKQKLIKAFKSVSDDIKLRIQVEAKEKVHPWRLCPGKQFYRKQHSQRSYVKTSGVQVKGSIHPNECVKNKSGKDMLYSEEIDEIALRYFGQLTELPIQGVLTEYENEKEFDAIIAGWTKYWNEVLRPEEPLDPDLVKAIIATESSFSPKAWNKKKGRGRARGLMHVTDESVKYLSFGGKDLSDHFVNLKQDDMLDPNRAICAGVRWLFRKREIVRSKTQDANWIDSVLLYKNYSSVKDEQMQKLVQIYERLRAGRKSGLK